MGIPEAKAEKLATLCTPQIPLCRSLAPHFVDADNPLKQTPIKDRQPLSKDYDLVVLLARKQGVFIVNSMTNAHYLKVGMLPDMWWQLTRVGSNFIPHRPQWSERPGMNLGTRASQTLPAR